MSSLEGTEFVAVVGTEWAIYSGKGKVFTGRRGEIGRTTLLLSSLEGIEFVAVVGIERAIDSGRVIWFIDGRRAISKTILLWSSSEVTELMLEEDFEDFNFFCNQYPIFLL